MCVPAVYLHVTVICYIVDSNNNDVGYNFVQVWNLTNCKLKTNHYGHTGYVNTVTVSPDGSLCASGGKVCNHIDLLSRPLQDQVWLGVGVISYRWVPSISSFRND